MKLNSQTDRARTKGKSSSGIAEILSKGNYVEPSKQERALIVHPAGSWVPFGNRGQSLGAHQHPGRTLEAEVGGHSAFSLKRSSQAVRSMVGPGEGGARSSIVGHQASQVTKSMSIPAGKSLKESVAVSHQSGKPQVAYEHVAISQSSRNVHKTTLIPQPMFKHCVKAEKEFNKIDLRASMKNT